ncbi:MAG TPA: glycine C-acetyltransferase [Polyangiaceae bacterium]|jgi:glycine C-acetyltransferase|nr:glycine C-acetyltransferase [Polyangiaceae bacterium]
MYEGARDAFAATLEEIRSAGLEKSERRILGPQGASIRVQESPEPVLNFCANNYLGLSSHPRVLEAAREALEAYGYGLSSVRFICGTQDLHQRLEGRLARFFGMDDAILYSSCFDANGGLFETLLDERDAVISDALNHASIIDGVRLCKAERLRYPHGDMGALEQALAGARDKRLRLVATDGVFSMDGDLAPLQAICDLADRYRALVMVDDSHASGFVGPTGRGSIEHAGVMGRVDILTSTLGKALGGAAGGFTAARKEIVAVLRQRSRPYLFSNTLAPPIAGASLAVLDLLESTGGAESLAQRVMRNAARFRGAMTQAGFRIKPGFHPIVPVMMTGPRSGIAASHEAERGRGPASQQDRGAASHEAERDRGPASQQDRGPGAHDDARLAQDVAAALLAEGIYVVGFSFPVVPKGQARIRVQLSAAHSDAMIDRAVEAFARVGKRYELI